MKGVGGKGRPFSAAGTLLLLGGALAFGAGAEWKSETFLVERRGLRTAVRALAEENVLFSNVDPQLCIEWALAKARTAVVLPGRYTVGDSVEIPRDSVTLIISPGAELSLNPDTEHTTDIGFRSSRTPGFWKIIPLIYNRRHNNVRVVHLGRIRHFSKTQEQHGEQTFPIVFDGRTEKRTCGVRGGLLVVAGAVEQSCLLLDCRGVDVPLVAFEAGVDALLCLEGCEECRLGMIANLASQVGGAAGETVDLNSSNRRITIERLIGQRSQEIIDCNGSHVQVEEIICIGKPRKFMCFTVGSGPRWTSRPRAADRIDIFNAAVLKEPTRVALVREVPELPGALPRFAVKVRCEVDLKDGTKEVYSKEVTIDVRNHR